MAEQIIEDFPIVPTVDSGTELAELLNRLNIDLSNLRAGDSRPVTAVEGMLWRDTSDSPTEDRVYYYDGTNDILFFTVKGGVIDMASSSGDISITGLFTIKDPDQEDTAVAFQVSNEVFHMLSTYRGEAAKTLFSTNITADGTVINLQSEYGIFSKTDGSTAARIGVSNYLGTTNYFDLNGDSMRLLSYYRYGAAKEVFHVIPDQIRAAIAMERPVCYTLPSLPEDLANKEYVDSIIAGEGVGVFNEYMKVTDRVYPEAAIAMYMSNRTFSLLTTYAGEEARALLRIKFEEDGSTEFLETDYGLIINTDGPGFGRLGLRNDNGTSVCFKMVNDDMILNSIYQGIEGIPPLTLHPETGILELLQPVCYNPPVVDADLANKEYVDTAVAAGGGGSEFVTDIKITDAADSNIAAAWYVGSSSVRLLTTVDGVTAKEILSSVMTADGAPAILESDYGLQMNSLRYDTNPGRLKFAHSNYNSDIRFEFYNSILQLKSHYNGGAELLPMEVLTDTGVTKFLQPVCTRTPDSGHDLVNKNYADSLIGGGFAGEFSQLVRVEDPTVGHEDSAVALYMNNFRQFSLLSSYDGEPAKTLLSSIAVPAAQDPTLVAHYGFELPSTATYDPKIVFSDDDGSTMRFEMNTGSLRLTHERPGFPTTVPFLVFHSTSETYFHRATSEHIPSDNNDLLNLKYFKDHGRDYTLNNLGSISSNQTIDVNDGTTIKGTFTASAQITISSTVDTELTFLMTNGGGRVSWGTSIRWEGGTEPSWSTSGVDIVKLQRVQGSWYGSGKTGYDFA